MPEEGCISILLEHNKSVENFYPSVSYIIRFLLEYIPFQTKTFDEEP